ncbi:MAG: peptidoglycan DD-metalloendopeptidase family protein [Myxococcales bacterium]|nr:peptidoglycan DD-metalloendopeptidase family protein [Myxococcales bacterium]
MALGIHAVALIALLQGQLPDSGVVRATREVEALRKRAARERIRSKYLRDEEYSLLRSLDTLEKQILAKLGDMDQLQKEGERIDESLQLLREEQTQVRVRLISLRRLAGRRVAAMVRMRRSAIAQFVTSAENPLAARRMRDRIRFVLNYDHSLMEKTRKASERAEIVEQDLLNQSAARAAGRAEIEVQIQEIERLREEREILAEAIRSERQTTERMMMELEDAAHNLHLEMGRIHGEQPPIPALPGGFGAQKGRLPWPTIGQLEVTFGKRVDPDSEMILVSKGIDIRADQNENVRAVFDGRVMFAERFEGFGNLVILSHDGGYYTLYGHLESFAVSAGMNTAQYQVVGFVGDSGSIKGAYLYFEIRDGREPVNPMEWLNREH